MTKAATLAADSVILDLEDAVPAGEKARSRDMVRRASNDLDWGRKELCVRVNQIGTREHLLDLSAVRRMERVDVILIPKAEGDASRLAAKSDKSLIPIIETAKGLMTLGDLARSKGVVAITYGAADYASSVGGSVETYQDNLALKTLIVAAARAYGGDPIDNVYFVLENHEGFRAEAARARSLGFTGKQVVHPSQIAIANEVFSPSEAEIGWAKRVISEFEAAGAAKRGAIRVDGRLVDAVHYRLAKGILDRA